MSQSLVKSIRDKQKIANIAAIVNLMARRSLSAGPAHANPNPHGWKSWRDIPDSMIPTTSKRDPTNPIYGTRQYVDGRKQQIWFQIPDGVPVFLKNGIKDQVAYYGLMVAVLGVLLVDCYYMGQLIFGTPKPRRSS